MNKMMKLLALVMALVMILCLAACTEDKPDNTEPSSSESTTVPTTKPTEPSTEPTDDGMKTYTVTLKDSEGNPLSGVSMQICLESCTPGFTDDNGVATFEVLEKSGYSVGVSADYDNTMGYYEDGQYDVTIVWDAPSVAE